MYKSLKFTLHLNDFYHSSMFFSNFVYKIFCHFLRAQIYVEILIRRYIC